ncbi:MAG: cell division ATP-binding protein FtsE [Deferribacteres bacterium]|nr:cell division ATP-binding protein FtsE [candidate division KSB1 bacterium]MCB9511906.1 cell division ATP-binding protein FtsE [Deferribacteres bacterium]
MNIVRLNNVGMNYVTGDGVKNINFELEQGEFLFLVGPSGAGKSTVLKLIYFEEMPFVGEVEVGQISSKSHKRSEIAYLRRQLGIVFQDFRLLEDRNVFENIAFVLRVTGMRRQDIKKRVLRVLTDVGISHKRYKMPHELSGGEQQRVAIARAIANEPLVLLADEPTGNLDPDTADEIMQLLEVINTRGTAVIMATHNYNLVKKHNHRVVRIEEGITRA